MQHSYLVMWIIIGHIFPCGRRRGSPPWYEQFTVGGRRGWNGIGRGGVLQLSLGHCDLECRHGTCHDQRAPVCKGRVSIICLLLMFDDVCNMWIASGDEMLRLLICEFGQGRYRLLCCSGGMHGGLPWSANSIRHIVLGLLCLLMERQGGRMRHQ